MSSLPWKSLTPGCPRQLSLRLQTHGLDLQGPSRSKLSTLAVMSKNTHRGTNGYGQCIVDLATAASSKRLAQSGCQVYTGWMNLLSLPQASTIPPYYVDEGLPPSREGEWNQCFITISSILTSWGVCQGAAENQWVIIPWKPAGCSIFMWPSDFYFETMQNESPYKHLLCMIRGSVVLGKEG